jgi:hypothetical protein
MSSVLNKYKRQPKLYITIPSELRFVPEAAYEGSFKDVPVYSMSGSDELMMRNPEALLNGEATINLIKSCIPSIKDPNKLSFIDLEFLLLSIRIATYGNEYTKNSICPHCSESNAHAVNLSALYDSFGQKEYDNTLTIGDLKFYLRPLSIEKWNEVQEEIFIMKRTVAQAVSLGEEERSKIESKAYKRLADLSENSVSSQVEKIVTPDGEETDIKLIKDFLIKEDQKWFNAIRSKLESNIKKWEIAPLEVKCAGEKCGKDYATSLTMDDANFFVQY